MTIENYITARKLLEEAEPPLIVDATFQPTNATIDKAERELAVTFPPSYKQFLADYGSAGFIGWEIYGIVREDFQNSGIPDAIWYTLQERKDFGLDPKYVIIEDGGDGTVVAIDTSKRDGKGECPLVRLSLDGKPIEDVSESFGTWLLEQLQWRIANRQSLP